MLFVVYIYNENCEPSWTDASEVMYNADISVVGGEELEVQGSTREGPCSTTHLLLALAVAAVGVGVSFVALQGSSPLT